MSTCSLKVIDSMQDLERHVKKRPVGENIVKHVNTGWREIKVEKGLAFIKPIIEYDEKDYTLSVSDNVAIEGTVYPKHDHVGWESFVVYKGAMNLFIEESEGLKEVKISCIGKPYYFNAKYIHWGEFDRLTRFTATLIPFEPDWS